MELNAFLNYSNDTDSSNGIGWGNGSGYSDSGSYIYGYGGGGGDGYDYIEGDGSGDINDYGNGYNDGYGDVDGFSKVWVDHKTPIIAYHVVNANLTLNYNLRKVSVYTGLVLEIDTQPDLCRWGFHASLTPEDTKKSVDGGVMTRVACSGWVKFDDNKLVCTRREVLEILPLNEISWNVHWKRQTKEESK